MYLFLEVVEGGMAGRSVWLEPGDVCRYGSDTSNELVLPGKDIPSKAGTLLFTGAGAKLIQANQELQCGEAFSVGPFRIQLRQYPASPADGAPSPLGGLIDWMSGRPGNLYAIYDAARDGAVLDLLNAAKLKQLSLFDGDSRDRMADAAPYLVEIPKDSPALELLVRASWGKGWATFLASEAAFADVRAQLRRSLIAQLPTGETAFFRFFDPAVLQAFLRGSNPQEWLEFAGPITEFIVEQREGPAIAVRLRVPTATIETYRLEEIANAQN
jgi:hypothetical protein